MRSILPRSSVLYGLIHRFRFRIGPLDNDWDNHDADRPRYISGALWVICGIFTSQLPSCYLTVNPSYYRPTCLCMWSPLFLQQQATDVSMRTLKNLMLALILAVAYSAVSLTHWSQRVPPLTNADGHRYHPDLEGPPKRVCRHLPTSGSGDACRGNLANALGVVVPHPRR